jgi:hypothetical protein
MNINLGNKLFGAILFLLMLTGKIGFIGFSSLRNLKIVMEDMFKNFTSGLYNIDSANLNFVQIRLTKRQAILEEDSAKTMIFEGINTSTTSLAELVLDLSKIGKKIGFIKSFA